MSRKMGSRARLRVSSAARHSRTRQALCSSGDHRVNQYPTRSSRPAFRLPTRLVAYIDFNGGIPDFFNSSDFKLRCFQGSHRRQVILDFFEKSLATGNQIRSNLSSQDLDPIRRAHRGLPLRNQASRLERRVEKLFQNGNSRWCRLETRSPLIKRPHDFERVLFCDKLVRTRSHQPEQIIERRLGGIVRCEAKIIQRESGLIAPSPRG